MRSMPPLAQYIQRTSTRIPALLLLALLSLPLPSLGQPEAKPDPVQTPAAAPATPEAPATPTAPVEGQAPAAAPEGDKPAVDPSASPSPNIEDLYAPDLPKKPSGDKEPPAAEVPKNKDPILYITDTDNGRIVMMQGITGEGFTSVGLPGYGLGRFLRPAQIWLDYAGRLYVADSGNNRVVRIDQNAAPGWTEVGDLSEPRGVAVDGSGVYVSDTKANRIVIYNELVNNAKIREVLTHPQLKRPSELWIDGQGALYICCGEDPPGGKLLKTWMEKGLAENGVQKETRRWMVFEGEGLSGSRFLPASVITSQSGVRMLDVSGQRLVSMQDMTGKRLKEDKFRVDPRWRLSRPTGMAVDQEGRIYIADSGNNRILELSKDGSVVGEFYILEDDPGTLLSNPSSIFIYSPAPPPPPKEDKDEDGKGKKKPKPKAKPKEDPDLDFENDF